MPWTPQQLKKQFGTGREDTLQKSCVKWFRLAYPRHRRRLIASLNGAPLRNGAKTWKHLEAMGAVAGEADLFLAVPSGEYGGLFIEMKTHAKHSKQRDTQKEFEVDVIEHYGYVICRDLDEFMGAVERYLETGEFE